MKIEIENTVELTSLQARIFWIVNQSFSYKNIVEFYDFLKKAKANISGVDFGKGGSHIWVSISGKRILMITE